MKKLCVLSFFLLLAAGCQSSFRPQSSEWKKNDITVRAELKKRDGVPELGPLLYLTIVNESQSEISIRKTRPLDEFKIMLFDKTLPEKEVQLTPPWRDAVKKPLPRHRHVVIAPGESFSYEPVILKDIFMIQLEKEYKMKVAGTYFVRDTRSEEIYMFERIKWYNQ